ncbi:uncharacterized protein LOC123886917 [Trifolium pratense]|uniref:uncharacterized protein LOC123886917 n=1 Tax=Trifolium pratense TaxID=57577 RepID=UPI001E693EC7|nr:uncharacterized protein LOC123886917 [Trifolium pratense]
MDSNKIHSLFPLNVANSILAVPFDDVKEDNLVWEDDMHGNYSVKSGYNLLLKPTVHEATMRENAEWKWLWKIQAPQKTKHLLWRICKGCLLTNAAFDCNEAGKAAMLLWVLWQNRNNWVWNNMKEQGQQIGINAMRLWDEWEIVQAVNNSSRETDQQQYSLQWQPPSQGKYKCNVDAGFHNDVRKTSVGWCVRDHRGKFILGGTSWIQGRCSTNEGEAIAMLEAMKELSQKDFRNVIFETDSQNVVNAIVI